MLAGTDDRMVAADGPTEDPVGHLGVDFTLKDVPRFRKVALQQREIEPISVGLEERQALEADRRGGAPPW